MPMQISTRVGVVQAMSISFSVRPWNDRSRDVSAYDLNVRDYNYVVDISLNLAEARIINK